MRRPFPGNGVGAEDGDDEEPDPPGAERDGKEDTGTETGRVSGDARWRDGGGCELKPFYEIQELKRNYIDYFYPTLYYYYPNFIGGCYKCFILAAQEKDREVLKIDDK